MGSKMIKSLIPIDFHILANPVEETVFADSDDFVEVNGIKVYKREGEYLFTIDNMSYNM